MVAHGAAQTSKRDLEKVVKQQERKLAQQTTNLDNCLTQISQLDELHKAVSRRAEQLRNETDKLADNRESL